MMPMSAEGKGLVGKIAERYRQQGYEVVEEPSPADLPFELGSYRPDLLVIKADAGSYIVEVKATSKGIPVDRYRTIAEQVASHPGWRFLLVTEDESLAGSIMTWDQIEERMEQALRLRRHGELEAGFLTLWTILEAAMRNRAQEITVPLERLSTSSMVNHLYSQGELSIEQFDTARELQTIRNQMVHGFQAGGIEGGVSRLYDLVHELIDEWNPSRTEAADPSV